VNLQGGVSGLRAISTCRSYCKVRWPAEGVGAGVAPPPQKTADFLSRFFAETWHHAVSPRQPEPCAWNLAKPRAPLAHGTVQVFPHSTQAMMAYRDGSVNRADVAATVPTADKVSSSHWPAAALLLATPGPHAPCRCRVPLTRPASPPQHSHFRTDETSGLGVVSTPAVLMSQPQLHRTVSGNITVRYGNTVRNFPTHGQLSAAQGNPTKLSLNFDNILTPRLCDLMVRRWSLTAHFLILYNPGGVVWVPDERAAHQGEPLARQGGARRTGRRSYCTPSETPIDFKEPIVRPLKPLLSVKEPIVRPLKPLLSVKEPIVRALKRPLT
jgi:hypothetical protein